MKTEKNKKTYFQHWLNKHLKNMYLTFRFAIAPSVLAIFYRKDVVETRDKDMHKVVGREETQIKACTNKNLGKPIHMQTL